MAPFRLSALLLWPTLMMVISGLAPAQTYPVKPVRIITSGAGGGNDVAARLVAQGLTDSLGQQVIVENRPAVIGIGTAAKAMPDGYTLLVAGNSLWLLPLMGDTSFDPIRDFSPIAEVARSPGIVVVHPSLPAKSVKELIALARAKPGQLNYASGGTGSSNHLAAELFKHMAGINIVRIFYRSGGLALSSLVGGEVQLMLPTANSVTPHVKSGRLKALAVTSADTSVLAPGLPTVSASGLPGYESIQIYGAFVPAGTPSALIVRLNQDISRFLALPAAKEKFFNIGSETVNTSPEQLATMIKSEIIRMGKVIKAADIKGSE